MVGRGAFRRTSILWTLVAPIALCLVVPPVWAGENLIVNGRFEDGLTGWSELWTREPSGRADVDAAQPHAGTKAVRIEHTGRRDWSFSQSPRLEVEPGEIYEISGWIRGAGEGTATLCVTLRGEGDRVLDWSYGERTVPAAGGWRELRSRFAIPSGARTVEARWIGNGPATVWLDDTALYGTGTVAGLRANGLPPTLELGNGRLRIVIDLADARFSVRDLRTDRLWDQAPPPQSQQAIVLDGKVEGRAATLRLLDPKSLLELTVVVRAGDAAAEFSVEISAAGQMATPLAYPYAFATEAGQWLILPVNEGIGYPVDDPTLRPMSYYLYGGHGLCMAWYGIAQGAEGLLTLIDTPDDAAVGVPSEEGRLRLAPQWLPQRGQFGETRRMRYVLLESGGYVAMCKRYREQMRQEGRLVTLAAKREKNPHVDQLIGAVNVWCWDTDAVGLCRELRSLGIERILWSNRGTPDSIRQLNELGVLTSRYDIYQDVMNPENFPKLRGIHGDWTTKAWPRDLAIEADGQWTRGWEVEGKDGQWYPCGVLCDRQALSYARERLQNDLASHPYRCRFIDTTTASPWRECYHPDHPMTRSESKHWKLELLRLVSDEFGMVTGSETGHDAAVPFVHYFEGMLSLGPYRVPDSGRRMIEVVEEPPERVAKFQTGHYYRLPLWELVYHDCVVAQWYWGDYNNKLPKLWDRRDLFNALYGTPPMFMFNRQIWNRNRERFARSYQTATPVARATGYVEMLDHRWLTTDHTVQRTEFANGIVVTVNFGDQPYTLAGGSSLAPLAHRVEGLAP